MNVDFVKINRKIIEWEWYQDINTCRLFLHMIFIANWKDGKFMGTTVPRGSFVSSIDKLADATSLTNREVRTAISHLKTTGEVTSKSTNRYTVFTVVNYDLYQSNDNQSDNQPTSNRHSNDILTTTIEEKKEGKKGRREEKKKEVSCDTKKKEPFPDSPELNKAFCDYMDMRKQIKKPMTDTAIDLAIKKLNQLAELPFAGGMDEELAIQILEQSIMNSWQGLFPLKNDQPKGRKENSKILEEWANA